MNPDSASLKFSAAGVRPIMIPQRLLGRVGPRKATEGTKSKRSICERRFAPGVSGSIRNDP